MPVIQRINALILGPLSFFPKAAQCAGVNTTALWGGGTRAPREIAELQERADLFVQGRWIDAVSWRHFLAGAGEIARIALERESHLIHANGVWHLLRAYWVKQALRIRYGRRVAVAVSLHNPLPWTLETGKSKRRLTAFLIQQCADLAIPIANFNRRGLAESGVDPAKIVTVPVCIDVDQFERRMHPAQAELPGFLNLAEGEALVSYIAALNPVKGHRIFIRAAEETLQVLPRTRFLIVGDGSCRAELEGMVRERGLQDRVIFTGNVPPPVVAQIFAATTVSVCASYSEMMPMAVIEALAAGKAVVATRVGGIPELISDGGSGLLVPPGDAEALSRALQVLLQNAGERARLGRAGQEHIRAHHSLQAVGERLAEAYRRALDLAGIGA